MRGEHSLSKVDKWSFTKTFTQHFVKAPRLTSSKYLKIYYIILLFNIRASLPLCTSLLFSELVISVFHVTFHAIKLQMLIAMKTIKFSYKVTENKYDIFSSFFSLLTRSFKVRVFKVISINFKFVLIVRA
jgi:hypothetical protein